MFLVPLVLFALETVKLAMLRCGCVETANFTVESVNKPNGTRNIHFSKYMYVAIHILYPLHYLNPSELCFFSHQPTRTHRVQNKTLM